MLVIKDGDVRINLDCCSDWRPREDVESSFAKYFIIFYVADKENCRIYFDKKPDRDKYLEALDKLVEIKEINL